MIPQAYTPRMPASSEMTRASVSPMPVEASGGLSATMTTGGFEIRDTRPASFWAIITGQGSASNRYSFVQIDDGDSANNFDTTLSIDFAASGGTTEVDGCAYEINGNTSVATGTKVQIHPAGDLSFYVFSHPAGGTSPPLFFGQPHSTPGGLMVWHDPSGAWAGEARGLHFWHQSFGSALNSQLAFTLPDEFRSGNYDTTAVDSTNNPNVPTTAFTVAAPQSFSVNRNANGTSYTVNRQHSYGSQRSPQGNNAHTVEDRYGDGQYNACLETFSFANNTRTIVIYTELVGSSVVRTHSDNTNFQYWMAHYSSDGTPGISAGTGFKDGVFVARQPAIAPLSLGASLTDVINKVNEIIASDAASGLTN